jgi:uroporphyrinogen decarboxylase-like protein
MDASATVMESLPNTSGDTPTLRDRFVRTMTYQPVAQCPNFEFGYWDQTLSRWREQGMPEEVVDEATAYDYFGIEHWEVVEVGSTPLPIHAEEKVIEETDERLVYRDRYGCIAEINKHGDRSIPHFLDYPVKDRKTWEPFVAALDPDSPERWEKFEESLEKVGKSTGPVGVTGGSMAGVARNLMGFERIATMQYEDPDFLREVIDTFGECAVAVVECVLARRRIDFCMGWEDICFNQGPIISPDFFREAVGPWYRRISDLLVAHGCCVYTTDTDGNILPLAGIFLDNGLNTAFPVEVHAGSDPCLLRERYGRRIKLWGGVNKRKVAESRAAIDAELERLRPHFEEGGFIPGFDHRVPADVPLDLYKHYLDRKRAVFNVGGEPRY